jgi:hypothetical protein
MNSDSFSPEEQDLIRKLQGVAKARLSARTMDAIRHRMLSEMDAPALPRVVRRSVIRRSWFAMGVAAAVTLFVVGVLLTNRPPAIVAITQTAGQTRVASGHTATPTITASVESSPTPTPTATATVEFTHTMTAESANATAITMPVVTLTPSPTAFSTVPSATATPETVIALEGPIEHIQGNTIMIYGIDISIPAGNPILDIVETGDVVRVEGSFDEQTGLVATVIENLLDDETDTATVGLDGPIEAINGKYVTINGIELDLSKATAELETLVVGDFLSVRGNIETRGSRFVLAVVSVEVLPNIAIATPAGCYYHEPGMGMGKGHWHCEGMGMGMGMGQLP